MFGNRNTASCNNKGASCRNIISAKPIAASADNIHRIVACLNCQRLVAHDACRRGDIIDLFTAHFQRDQKGGHLGFANITIHDCGKTGLNRAWAWPFASDKRC